MCVAVPLSCIAACPGCGGDTVNLRQIGLTNCVAVCFVCAVQSLELVLTELLYWKGVVLRPFDALPLESASLKITQHLYLSCFRADCLQQFAQSTSALFCVVPAPGRRSTM